MIVFPVHFSSGTSGFVLLSSCAATPPLTKHERIKPRNTSRLIRISPFCPNTLPPISPTSAALLRVHSRTRLWVPHPQPLEGAGLDSAPPTPNDDRPVAAIISQIAGLKCHIAHLPREPPLYTGEHRCAPCPHNVIPTTAFLSFRLSTVDCQPLPAKFSPCQKQNPPSSKPNSFSTSTSSAANPSCAKPAPTSAAPNSILTPPTNSSTPSAAAISKLPTSSRSSATGTCSAPSSSTAPSPRPSSTTPARKCIFSGPRSNPT